MKSSFSVLCSLGLALGVAQTASAFTVAVENDNGNVVTIYTPPTGVGLDVDKQFLNNQSITLRIGVTADDIAAGLVEISEGLLNDSGVAWADFHMELQGVPGGPTPTFAQSTSGYLWEAYGGDGEYASSTSVNGSKIDILWDVADGSGVYNGYFQATPGRLFIDVSNMSVDSTFFLIETPSVVPEPATMAGFGAALAFFARRRRSK